MLAARLFGAIALSVVVFCGAASADDPPAPPARSREPDKALVKTLKDAVIRAATGAKEETRAKAQAELAAAPRLERGLAYLDQLDYGHGDVRLYAARALAEAGEKGASPALAQAVVREEKKERRVDLLRALQTLAAPDTAVHFSAHLAEKDANRRLRSLVALGTFRDRRVVGLLILHLEKTLSGFGQAAVSFRTERSVIIGWRLISGGTGLSVVEVADPIIGTVSTGVTMEVKIRRVEIAYTVAVLQDLTGQEIGADPAAWRAWVAANPSFELAPATDK